MRGTARHKSRGSQQGQMPCLGCTRVFRQRREPLVVLFLPTRGSTWMCDTSPVRYLPWVWYLLGAPAPATRHSLVEDRSLHRTMDAVPPCPEFCISLLLLCLSIVAHGFFLKPAASLLKIPTSCWNLSSVFKP